MAAEIAVEVVAMMAGFALNVTILPDLTRGTRHLSPLTLGAGLLALTNATAPVVIFVFIRKNRIFAWILMDFYEVHMTDHTCFTMGTFPNRIVALWMGPFRVDSMSMFSWLERMEVI